MDLQLIIAVLLTLMPLIELRGGLPVAIEYAVSRDISIWPVFISILVINVLLVIAIFFFLDYLNGFFLRFKWWERFFNNHVEKTRKKAEKVQSRMKNWGYVALAGFVAVPLPLTGAYTGCLIAWILGLDRKKSIIAISTGVIVAGILVLLATLRVLSFIRVV